MVKLSDVSYQEFEQSLERKYMYYKTKLSDLPFLISRVAGASDHLCSKVKKKHYVKNV